MNHADDVLQWLSGVVPERSAYLASAEYHSGYHANESTRYNAQFSLINKRKHHTHVADHIEKLHDSRSQRLLGAVFRRLDTFVGISTFCLDFADGSGSWLVRAKESSSVTVVTVIGVGGKEFSSDNGVFGERSDSVLDNVGGFGRELFFITGDMVLGGDVIDRCKGSYFAGAAK
ncbi:hypothetical protein KC335_g43 [Hortaea werneckii]|nr:hypothetical protein KC335_g43 [Hortaea werneckii]